MLGNAGDSDLMCVNSGAERLENESIHGGVMQRALDVNQNMLIARA
jgi:hypothetical protein